MKEEALTMKDPNRNCCPVCGLPAFAPRFGSRVTCRYCRTVFTVEMPDGRKKHDLMHYRPHPRHKISGPGK